MNNIDTYHLGNFSNLIDNISTQQNWSVGADGYGGIADSTAFVLLEEIYRILNQRLEISSIKFIKNVTDSAAYEWHTDADNPTENNITKTALLYLPTCIGSILEFSNQTYYAEPYNLIIFNSGVRHRAVGQTHGPLLKYTLI
jgi:hypothetical protein